MTAIKKKVYVAVLVVGLGALILDRTALLSSTAPQSAEASAVASLGALGVASNEGSLVSVIAAPFPVDFPRFVSLPGRRDFFSLAGDARDLLGSGGGDPQSSDHRRGADGRVTPSGFRESYRLNAIMQSDGLSFAVVGGKWLRVGDELAGFKLTDITGTSVVFVAGTQEVMLSVIDNSELSDAGPD